MALSHNLENIQLWQKYKENDDHLARQELIMAYLSLVKYQAGRVKMMVPGFVEKDDLESFGIIGLIDAIEKFNYKKGVKFTTYASQRIRGEIIDHLRKLDWLPHSLRREGKLVKETVDQMTRELGHRPTLEEIASEVDIPIDKLNTLYYKLYSSQWVSIYEDTGDSQLLDLLAEDTNQQPDKIYQHKESLQLLTDVITRLEEQERLVISLYYYEELTQTEIAEVMNVSPARISQIHKKAVYRLRGFLSRQKEQFV